MIINLTKGKKKQKGKKNSQKVLKKKKHTIK